MMMLRLAACAWVALTAVSASAAMRITEYMYNDVEFIEFTNVGASPVDMTGWSMDDLNNTPGAFDLSGFGMVSPGESVIVTEADVNDFRTNWSLSPAVKVIGLLGDDSVGGHNLGRADQINLYDATSALVDRLDYGDQVFAGTPRAQNVSVNLPLGALGNNDIFAGTASVVGDSYGSYLSLAGEIGNPGLYAPVPEPGALALLGTAGGLTLLTRRRRRLLNAKLTRA